jgi:hypothetical protein
VVAALPLWAELAGLQLPAKSLKPIFVKDHLHRRSLKVKPSVISHHNLTSAIEIGSFLFYVALPKVAKASTLSLSLASPQ